MSDPSGSRGRLVLKYLVGAAVLLVLVDRIFPSIPLALLPHETVALPDPSPEPVQEETGRAPFREWRRVSEFVLTPRATYDISARVLSTESYWSGPGGALIPWDFALGWGVAADEDVIRRVSISQFSRFYTLSTHDPSVDVQAVGRSSANVHLVAASSRIERAFSRVRRGDLVRLEGELVDIAGPDGFAWGTSLTRDDTGPGACETLYVRSLTVGTRRYR